MGRLTWGVRGAVAVGAGLLMALLPPLTYGLGLGTLKVRSALNENLDAEIEFTAVTDRELKDLQIGLAPLSAFRVAGIELHPRLATIQFKVERRDNGRPYLRLSTKVPYPEPYLHILLQAEWTVGASVGRLRREYTALIDPPFLTASKPNGIRAPRPAPSSVAPEPELSLEETSPVAIKGEPELLIEEETAPKKMAKKEPELLIEEEPAPKKAPSTTVRRSEAMEEPVLELESVTDDEMILSEKGFASDESELLGPSDHLLPSGAPEWASTGTYRVKRGDTAYGIAQRIRRDRSVSIEQVVLALYDNNPRAFFDNNTSNLRAGKILKIPEKEFITRRSRRAAGREFRAQYDSWQEYKLKLASAKQPVIMGEPPAAKTADAKSGVRKKKKIARKPAKKSKPTVTAKSARKGMQIPPSRSGKKNELLRIVRANLDKKSQSAGKSAETESAKGKQQLTEKVTTLQGSKNDKTQPKAGIKAGKPRETTPSDKRLLQLENAELVKPAKPAAKTKPKAQVTAKATGKKPVKVAKARRKPVKRISPPAKKEESFIDMAKNMLDEVLSNQFILMIVGGIVVIGGAIGLIYARRRKKSLSEFEESILTNSDISTGEVSTGSEDIAGDSGDTSFLSDFSQGGMGNIATDEVDPIAEADVYLAYGRDEQAEEILKDSIIKSPARHELKEKLLEIYSQRGDVSAFETLAEELYAALEGKGGELWDRVSGMGSTLNPGNPMFQGGAPVPATASPESATPAMDVGAGLEMTAPEETQAIDLSQMQEEAMAPEIDMDAGGLDLDMPADSDKTEVVSDDALDGLEFSLDIGSGDTADVTPESNETESSSTDSGAIEFEAAAVPGQEEEISFDADEVPLESVADEGGLSTEEEDEFAALRENKMENNQPDMSVSIDTEVGVAELDASDMDTGLDMADMGGSDGLGLSAGEETAGDVDVAVAPEVEEVGADSGSADQWDEAATKLDLAKAYIDMGDSEGARSILEEVAVEGNEDQKRQAAELASQVA